MNDVQKLLESKNQDEKFIPDIAGQLSTVFKNDLPEELQNILCDDTELLDAVHRVRYLFGQRIADYFCKHASKDNIAFMRRQLDELDPETRERYIMKSAAGLHLIEHKAALVIPVCGFGDYSYDDRLLHGRVSDADTSITGGLISPSTWGGAELSAFLASINPNVIRSPSFSPRWTKSSLFKGR